MAKDMTYAIAEARGRGLCLSTVAPALAMLQRAIEDGHGDEDFSAPRRPLAQGGSARAEGLRAGIDASRRFCDIACGRGTTTAAGAAHFRRSGV
jgi:hypothetical protein